MRLSNAFGVRVALTCFVWLLSLLHSQAQFQFVLTREELAADDLVDWSTLGDPGTTVASPFSIQSLGSLQLHVSQPGTFEIYTQNAPPGTLSTPGGWGGSFAPNDPVLYTGVASDGPVTIQFDTPVARVGAQVESGSLGAYQGTLEIFDSTGLRLDGITLSGTSTDLANNSALFLGVLSSSANISKLVFSVTVGTSTPSDFGINQLSLSTTPASIVPEPAFGWVLLAGCALLGFKFRRQ